MKISPVKRVAVIFKHNSQKARKEADNLKEWLKSKNVGCTVERNDAVTEKSNIFKDCDLIISLGGDGTLLSTVKNVLNSNIPILGVNMGSLGFLTDISLMQMYPSLECVLKGDFSISSRMTLSAKIKHKGKSNNYFVLNDVVINKKSLARIIELELTVNDTLVTTYKSDGIIISTPTGSTAYSLSAGGPIVYPSVDCIIISPICSHTLTLRPIIVPANSVIKVKLVSKSDDVQLTLDGQVGDDLEYLNEVVIRKSKKKIHLIESFEQDYFEVLRTKLHWGKRGSK